jgi:hypothetical protein
MSYKKEAALVHNVRSGHHHMSKPWTETNAPGTAQHHPQPLGREDQNKSLTPAPSSPTLCHAEASTRCRLERPLSSSTSWDCDPRTAHTRSSIPLIQWSISKHSHLSRGATTNPDHSACVAHLSHCLTPLPRTRISKTVMRASPSPSHHRVHHCTLHDTSSPLAPMGPQHLDSNMDQACFSQHLQTTSTTTSKNDGAPNITPPRRSQRKVLSSHIQMDEVFTLRAESHATRA